jgi:tRNA(Arg) A34 adenosine deaminase TadA
MAFVVGLARHNVASGTGGPFGAAVVGRDTGQVVSVGVNVVVPTGNCTAHAEMLALQLAESRLGGLDLGRAEGGPYELVTSVEPCAMCLGAISWSGVAGVICGARDEDARAIGFDEGPKPARWVEALGARGITVVLDLQRDASVRVLREYQEAGGPVYNGTAGGLARQAWLAR